MRKFPRKDTRIAILITAALALVGCATPGPEEIRGANFAGPSVDPSRQPFFPQAAQAANVQGFVIMQCNLAPRSRLTGCEVLFESLPGWGFGAAGLQLASRLVVPADTAPVGSPVIQAAYFCLNESFCQRARASVDAARQDWLRRKAAGAVAPAATASTDRSRR